MRRNEDNLEVTCASAGSSAVLTTERLSVTFGSVRAVDGVSISIERGRITGLIGPNGAGKTTMVDAITGFVPSMGTILLNGEEIQRMSPHERARLGMSRTWQSLELFDDLDVCGNVAVAATRIGVRQVAGALIRPRRGQQRSVAMETLELFGLESLAGRLPSELTHGQRKLVGVARALAAQPQLLLIDEPAAGLDDHETEAFGDILRSIVQRGITILLIDHHMGLVLGTCDYVYVLDFGRMLAEGPPEEIRQNPAVVVAYLGEPAHDDQIGDGFATNGRSTEDTHSEQQR